MLIQSFTGSTSKESLSLEKSSGRLMITADVNTANEKITVDISKKDGSTQNLINRLPIKHLFEIAQHQEGAYKKFITGGEEIGMIDLSPDGSIKLGDDEQVIISLYDLNSAKNYSVYAIENPVLTNTMWKYSKQTLEASKESKTIDVSRLSMLAIVDNADFINIKLNFPNGYQATYSRKELQMLQHELNDLVYHSGSITDNGEEGNIVKFGFDTLLILPLNGVLMAEINSDGDSAITYYTRELITK